jgi:hypothetical protein
MIAAAWHWWTVQPWRVVAPLGAGVYCVLCLVLAHWDDRRRRWWEDR